MSYSRIVDKNKEYERKIYYKDKECTIVHREAGPAIEYKDGSKEWWINGKPHRINGPCAEWVDGEKWFAINGIPYEEEEYWSKVKFGGFV